MDKEIWKIINEFPEYEISNFGRVASNKYKTRRILTLCDNGKGYKQVHLLKNGKRYVQYVHILVYKYFGHNYNNNLKVNHIDFNTSNNHISNLNQLTQLDNIRYSKNNGRYDNVVKTRNITISNNIRNKMINLSDDIVFDYTNGLTNVTKLSRKYHLAYKYTKQILIEYNVINKSKIRCVETGEEFMKISDANKKYGVTTIKDCISGRQKTSANLHWEKIS